MLYLTLCLFKTGTLAVVIKIFFTIPRENIIDINPFRLSFSELKCARGGHIIFLESIFQHSPHEIVIYSINRKSYNKKVNIL